VLLQEKKRDSALAYFEFHLGYFSQCQQSYVVFTRAQLSAEPVSRASPWQAPAAPSRWKLQNLGTSLDFSQIFFTIRMKITSANEYKSIFQFSEVAVAPDTSALTTELMHQKDALGDNNPFVFNVTPTNLCTLSPISLLTSMILNRLLNAQFYCCFQACCYAGMPG